MRRLSLAALFSVGCGVKDYVATGPTLSEKERALWLDRPALNVPYTGEVLFPIPPPPFQLFALHYSEDIVIETRHPAWAMHEYARVEVDGRSLWIAKDSDVNGVQTVTADLDDLRSWLPEVPAPRREGPVEVVDRSDDAAVDVDIRYTNPAGEEVAVSFRARRPEKVQKKRNGSTFNHSNQIASVVLDIPRRQLSGAKASVTYNGEPARLRRLFGLVPIVALLDQTQAGFAAASMQLTADAGTLSVTRPAPGDTWATRDRASWDWDPVSGYLRAQGLATTTTWRFQETGDVSLGLIEVWVEQGGEELTRLALSSPLPDLRRPFDGDHERRFTIEVGG